MCTRVYFSKAGKLHSVQLSKPDERIRRRSSITAPNVRNIKSGFRSEAWELEGGRAQITVTGSLLFSSRGGYLLQMLFDNV